MSSRTVRGALISLCRVAAAGLTFRLASARDRAILLPDPKVDAPLAAHPNDPYIIINDAPKVAHLKQLFPEIYIGK